VPTTNELPYGTLDLDPEVYVLPGSLRRVRCFVRGCEQLLKLPAQGDVCPVHGIRCHKSQAGPTYSYADPCRNIIADQDVFASRVLRHPFKFDCRWIGYEKSEDALTWNVFRSLQRAGRLRDVVRLVTGQAVEEEPRLYLWGLCLTGDCFEPWDLLMAARRRFESALPVRRPPTEPDIGLYQPGEYLILIEAKFTSANPVLTDGQRKSKTSLTKEELLTIYQDPTLRILDVDGARKASVVCEQLWRNVVFAEWMAHAAASGTGAYVVNLTRAGHEDDSCTQFGKLMLPGWRDRFSHRAWEDVCPPPIAPSCSLEQLAHYAETKTVGLLKAFRRGWKSAAATGHA
jgi:hypothetical protein